MFANKHIVIALLVAPMLALIAWFAVDYFVAERPQAASPGSSYPLVAKPNCRRPGGECGLSNADLTVMLVVSRFDATGAELELTSAAPLGQAAAGFANDDVDEGPPSRLEPLDADRRRWRGRVSGRIGEGTAMRVLLRANEANFYAEVPVTFFFTE